MSTSNKRLIDDDQFRPSTLNSSVKKRLCLSLVPTVPQGGNQFLLSSSNNSKKISLDAGDRKSDNPFSLF
jgi:hypothetical protein